MFRLKIINIISQHRNDDDLLFSIIDNNGTLYYINDEMRKVLENHNGISLHCDAGIVTLIIKDNGIGSDSTQTRRGIGRSNIYERTRFYNGKVE